MQLVQGKLNLHRNIKLTWSLLPPIKFVRMSREISIALLCPKRIQYQRPLVKIPLYPTIKGVNLHFQESHNHLHIIEWGQPNDHHSLRQLDRKITAFIFMVTIFIKEKIAMNRKDQRRWSQDNLNKKTLSDNCLNKDRRVGDRKQRHIERKMETRTIEIRKTHPKNLKGKRKRNHLLIKRASKAKEIKHIWT